MKILYAVGGVVSVLVAGYFVVPVLMPADALAAAFANTIQIPYYRVDMEGGVNIGPSTSSMTTTLYFDTANDRISGSSKTVGSLMLGAKASKFTTHVDLVKDGNDFYFRSEQSGLPSPSVPEWIHIDTSSEAALSAKSQALSSQSAHEAILGMLKGETAMLEIIEQNVEILEGQPRAHYTLRITQQYLDSLAPEIRSGLVQMGLSTYDVWVDTSASYVVQISYSAKSMSAKTRITKLDEAPTITIPGNAISMEDYIKKQTELMRTR